MPEEPKRSPIEYFMSKLETAHNALNECVYFTDNEDLKHEVLELANHVSQIVDKLTPKPPPRLPPTTDEETYKRWLKSLW
jgi:hypothetical protein